MKYKSKIGFWFHLTVLLIFAGGALPIVLGIHLQRTSDIIVGTVFFLLINGLLVWPIYLATYYTLEETALHVRCGLCINKRIPYRDIRSIRETHDPSASAGLSFDRISIQYGKSEVLISPRNKQEFIRQLKQRIG